MTDPCLACPLPDCDESDPRCAWLSPQRAAQRRYSLAYRERNPFSAMLYAYRSERNRRINQLAQKIRGAA